jgi:hypothetical protein
MVILRRGDGVQVAVVVRDFHRLIGNRGQEWRPLEVEGETGDVNVHSSFLLRYRFHQKRKRLLEALGTGGVALEMSEPDHAPNYSIPQGPVGASA